ncbi:GntR family transcriptional regulator [Vagococcus zengguangii]|uniref:GntR family transcriptional regulator n=1 Tax=Vagococcus zengguangii TaxID=2571750 RepID=A0A4D7CSE4_9ENTE|nr:GntR family transcriptional regulator [Vagococcus zengguangii]QCI85582.1 GntR family transcriptional regulator [Vagococcus zengguangii]TLG79437.1 GntR family transcriptional regulator [Vagococcus zengguangii]
MNELIDVVNRHLDFSESAPLKTIVYHAFRKTIILGQIPAGSRINEKEFSAQLNISRTPIRYALEKLADEGLVVRIKGVGIIVKGISIKDAYEIYDIRKALDVLATITAAKLMTPTDFKNLKALLDETERLNNENDIPAVLEKFTEFNEFILRKSQMLRLESIVLKLREYLMYFRDISISDKPRRDKALYEHFLIYKGMLNQDEEQIRLIIEEHLDYSLHFIIKEMEGVLYSK